MQWPIALSQIACGVHSADIILLCVCVTLGVIGMLLQLFILQQGNSREGSGPFSSHCLTKTLLIGCDMTLGRQSHVPARFPFLFLPEWREAKPRTSRHV